LALGADALTVEEEMTLNAQLEPTGWWDDDAWLRSKIDVLVRRGTKAHVFDWKTGKRRPDFDQLELFAVQVFKHYPHVERVKASFVWLQTMGMDSETYSRDDVPSLLEKILGKVSRIEGSLEHDNWPAKPSGLCNWCPCKGFCEYAR
jgi:putative RecB family exonuclease